MVKALVDQGLYQREADAMVRTWWKSYFEQPGCRLFWIVPDSMVEEILPLKVTPAPRETKRVLVGRSEPMAPTFERDLMKHGANMGEVYGADRFYLAYEERVRVLNQLAALPPKSD